MKRDRAAGGCDSGVRPAQPVWKTSRLTSVLGMLAVPRPCGRAAAYMVSGT